MFTAQTAMAPGGSHHDLRRRIRHESIIRVQAGHRSGAVVFGWPISLHPDEPVHLTALHVGPRSRRIDGKVLHHSDSIINDVVALHGLGIDLPTPQIEVFDESGRFVGRVDGMWMAEGTVAEADGEGKYVLGPFDGGGASGKDGMPPAEWSPRDAARTTCGISGWRWCVGAHRRCVVPRRWSLGVLKPLGPAVGRKWLDGN